MAVEKIRAAGEPARIRAAVHYSGRQQGPIAKAVGISPSTLGRWMAGSKEGRQPGEADLAKLADACDVPLAFLRYGFDEPTLEEATELRFRALEIQLAELRDILAPLNIKNADDAAALIRAIRELVMQLGTRVGKRGLQSRRVLGQSKESA